MRGGAVPGARKNKKKMKGREFGGGAAAGVWVVVLVKGAGARGVRTLTRPPPLAHPGRRVGELEAQAAAYEVRAEPSVAACFGWSSWPCSCSAGRLFNGIFLK